MKVKTIEIAASSGDTLDDLFYEAMRRIADVDCEVKFTWQTDVYIFSKDKIIAWAFAEARRPRQAKRGE